MALGVAATGCGGSDASDGSTAAVKLDPPCKVVKPSPAKRVSYKAPRQTVGRGEELTATVRTSCGSFSIALDSKRSPAVVNSFVFLARRGFYDGIPLDKAGAGKFLHGGDPPGRAGGPGYTVPGRIPKEFIYRHGVVAMAEPGAGGGRRAGSQFFIVLAKPWLDFSGIYPPLGTVADGFDVLGRISEFGPGDANAPGNLGTSGPIGKLRRPVVIEKISIERGEG